MSRDFIDSISAEYRRYKKLGEGALAQITDAELSAASSPDDNSVATIVWHIAGNLKSRFTDFETTDGEKPWRNRDEEFDSRTVTRLELMEKWEDGWHALFGALDRLTDETLDKVVTIRQQPLTIYQALHRSMTHTSYHVGQMVYVAKAFRRAAWRSLSIPRGASRAFLQTADTIQRTASDKS